MSPGLTSVTPVHYSDIFIFEHHFMMWFVTFGHYFIMKLSSNYITKEKSG